MKHGSIGSSSGSGGPPPGPSLHNAYSAVAVTPATAASSSKDKAASWGYIPPKSNVGTQSSSSSRGGGMIVPTTGTTSTIVQLLNPVTKKTYKVDLDTLPRTKRLLIIALQFPFIEHLLESIGYAHEIQAMARRYKVWKAIWRLWKDEEIRKLQHQIKHAIPIQCMIRCYIAKQRVQHIRQQKQIKYEAWRYQQVLRIQCLIRKFTAKRRVIKRRKNHGIGRLHNAATNIQRVFRGYLGRGRVILLERCRLLRYLRQWSHGLTNNLYHKSDLQQVEQLALIHTAISFTLLPSKPIRNLPTVAQIKQYRVGLYLLFWQLKARYTRRKLELQQVLVDRQLMFKEEMYSMTIEIVLRAYRDKIRMIRLNEEMLAQREADEANRRNQMKAAQFLMDMQNSKMQKMREEEEGKWRILEQEKTVQWLIQEQTRLQYAREYEMMTFEDQYAAYCRTCQSQERHRQQVLQEEHLKLVHSQLQYYQQEHALIAKPSKSYKLTEEEMLLKLEDIEAKCVQVLLRSLAKIGVQESFIEECAATMRFFTQSGDYKTLPVIIQQEKPAVLKTSTSSKSLSKSLTAALGSRKSAPVIATPVVVKKQPFLESFLYFLLHKYHFNYQLLQHYLQFMKQYKPINQESDGKKKRNRSHFLRRSRPGTAQGSLSSTSRPGNTTHNQPHSSHAYAQPDIEAEFLVELLNWLDFTCASSSSTNATAKAAAGGKVVATHPWSSLLTVSKLIKNLQLPSSTFALPHLFSSTSSPRATKTISTSLTYGLCFTSTQVMQYSFFLQYAFLHQRRSTIYEELVHAIHYFQQTHDQLAIVRHQLKENKFTLRSERQVLQQEAVTLEKICNEQRDIMIRHSQYLTTFILYEIRLFVVLFCMQMSNNSNTDKSEGGKVERCGGYSIYHNHNPNSKALWMQWSKQSSQSTISIDPNLYWQDVLALVTTSRPASSTYSNHTIGVLDIMQLPIPPSLNLTHDGFRHVVKKKTAAVSSSVGSGKGSKSSASNRRRTTHTILKNLPLKKTSNRVKEQRYFDIAGENQFYEEHCEDYDFYTTALEVALWTEQVRHWCHFYEEQWKQDHATLNYVVYQRVRYLLGGKDLVGIHLTTGHAAEDVGSHSYRQHQLYKTITPEEAKDEADKTELEIRRKLAYQTKLSDLYEMLLLQSNLAVFANMNRLDETETSVFIAGEELDQTYGRHPISVMMRYCLQHNLQVSGKLTFPNPNMYSLSTIANPGAIATAKSFTFTDLIETHHNAIFSNFAKSTDCHLTASQYLMTLQIEHQEIHDIVQHVVGSRSLVIMSSAVEANVDADVSNMSRSKLVYKTHHAVDSNIRAVNTEASVMYLFPSYMQPVFRCGSYAPEESFFKRLQREQQASKRNAAEAAELGEYARIDMMDTKCDQHARTLLQFLYLRKLLRKKVIAPMILHASYQEISSNLMYEDIRSRVRRYEESVLKTYRKSIDEIIQLVKQRDVEEVKRVAQLQQEEDNAVCACLFPTKKYAKIYSSTDSKVIDDYVQVIRKYYALLTELSTHASTKRGQHHLRNLMKEALPALQSILRKHHRGGQASAASHPFEGVTTAIEDQASDVTGQAELASSGKVNSPTSSSMKGSTKESQKAATRSSFMTSAKIGNSESLVSTLTQSAKQPSHSSKQVNNASNISSGFISILSSPEFQKFLKKYEKYLTSFDQKRCLQELQQEATHFMDATKYFRKTSWVTGQKVFLDSEGKHVNPTNMIVSKLTEMSRLYDLLYQIDASNFIDGGVAMDTSTKLKMSLGSTKNKIKKATPQKQRDGVKNNLVETHRNGDLMPPQNKTACNVKCAEKYLAGGLRKTTVLCRMIEDEMINNRGLVIVESFEAQSMEAWDLQYASTATEKLYMLRSGFLAAPICDGSFQKYANVLLKEDKNSQQSMGRFVSSFAYEATHQMLAPKASTDAIVVLPTIRECWNTLPSEVIRKRYTSLAHVYVTNKKHSALAMLIKTQAHIRGYLLRKKRQIMKGKKVMSRNIV